MIYSSVCAISGDLTDPKKVPTKHKKKKNYGRWEEEELGPDEIKLFEELRGPFKNLTAHLFGETEGKCHFPMLLVQMIPLLWRGISQYVAKLHVSLFFN